VQTEVVMVGRVTMEMIEPHGSGIGVGDEDGLGPSAAAIMIGIMPSLPIIPGK